MISAVLISTVVYMGVLLLMKNPYAQDLMHTIIKKINIGVRKR